MGVLRNEVLGEFQEGCHARVEHLLRKLPNACADDDEQIGNLLLSDGGRRDSCHRASEKAQGAGGLSHSNNGCVEPLADRLQLIVIESALVDLSDRSSSASTSLSTASRRASGHLLLQGALLLTLHLLHQLLLLHADNLLSAEICAAAARADRHFGGKLQCHAVNAVKC